MRGILCVCRRVRGYRTITKEAITLDESTNQLFLSIPDADFREQLIFGQDYDPDDYTAGGIRLFKNLSCRTAQELMERGYLPSEDKQNDAPTAQEFIDFMTAHNPDNWTLHGYSVSPKREDVRISIDGIGSIGPLADHDMVDFLRTFRTANVLNAEDGKPVSCWYD